MPHNIILTKTSFRTYNRLSLKLKRGLDRCIAHLEITPSHGPHIKRIKGYPDCYRYQIGGWRILYEIDEDAREVRIYRIGTRGDVYKS